MIPPAREYGTLTDTVPELWQFIVGLRSDDLVAEMIQNEIDANSTHTILFFEEFRMTCSGNGDPVDEEGWERLTFLRGAGDLAPRKRSLIGVKNHGLKACFAIGDDIYVRSDGKCAHQTLYKHGRRKAPYPGATTAPFLDPKAPAERGTTVEVTYRNRPIVVEQGEPVRLAACSPEVIDRVFLAAISIVPERFVGAIRPDRRPRHVIELKHHRLGTAKFIFQAGRATKKGDLTTFVRNCESASDNETLLVPSRRERAVLGACSRPGGQSRDVADFYQASGKLIVEVAWQEDAKGRLIPEHGRLRYPIAYTDPGPKSANGLAAHYSAPFVSDVERHGLAEGADDWNAGLSKACDRLLVEAMNKILIPRIGAKALDLLVDPTAVTFDRTKELVQNCLKARALPVWSPRAEPSRRGRAGKPWHRCVVACFQQVPELIAPELVEAAPAGASLLSPGVHPTVVRILASRSLAGYGVNHVVFDERDVIARLGRSADSAFPWPGEVTRTKSLAEPELVSRHLDAIHRASVLRPAGPGRATAIEALAPAGVELPDDAGHLWAIGRLRLSAVVPRDLPGLDLPPLLHPRLAKHAIFKVPGWQLGQFALSDFLQSFGENDQSTPVKQALFRWIVSNADKIPAKSWPELRELSIWPAAGLGSPCALDALCVPRKASTARILGVALKRPSKSLMKLAATMRKRRLSLPFRACPTAEEIRAWLVPRLEVFPRDRVLSEDEQAAFRNFERELSLLSGEPRLAEALRAFAYEVPALSRSGRLKVPADLVRNTAAAALHLRDDDLIERVERALDDLFPPAESATAAMVEGALRAAPQNAGALVPRLRVLADLMVGDRRADLGVGDVPCIPVHGEFRSPASLAFKGNEGNFWGDWRREISGKNLSQADQALYKRAGVLSAEPRADTSQRFFDWLSKNPILIEKHLPQVLRHFAHERGVQAWWATSEGVTSLPVQGANGVALIDYRAATARFAPCYVDDFPELGDAIRASAPNIQLAIDKHQDVRRPITEVLVAAGVKSLRLTADKPSAVTGDNPREAPAWAMDIFSQFCSEKMAAGLQKRIVALGISSRLMALRWHRNLQAVSRIVCASRVVATYRLGRQQVSTAVRHAFDAATGVLWLAERGNEADMEDAFFEALAERVFIAGAPPYCAPALEKSLKVEVKEAQRAPSTTNPIAEPQEPDVDGDPEPGEAPEAHHDWKPDPGKNIPSPGPLPGNELKPRQTTGRGVKPARQRPVVPDERGQTVHLKENHYAWHCQIGLATQTPSVLAPSASYVEHQENRQRLIDAHHPDAVDAGGARHAGNILILSHLRHHQYGRHISRGQITDALRHGGSPRQVTFGAGPSATIVDGVVVEVVLAATGEIVPIFFTKWHRDYWLSKAT